MILFICVYPVKIVLAYLKITYELLDVSLLSISNYLLWNLSKKYIS